MKKAISLSVALALSSTMSAFAGGYSLAGVEMSKEELIDYAESIAACGEDRRVLDAYVKEDGKTIGVVCDRVAGVVPLSGGLGGGAGVAAIAAGVALVAIAAGGGGSSPDTQ